MKPLISIILLVITLFNVQEQTVKTDLSWPAITKEIKPWTRWWWLGNAVDKAGITFRLNEMAKAGLGGVEITPIYGTKGFENKFIDFLSPAWMAVLAHTVNEGKRLNMGIDMNTGRVGLLVDPRFQWMGHTQCPCKINRFV